MAPHPQRDAVLGRRVGLRELEHVDGHLDRLGDVLGVAVVEAHGGLSRRWRLRGAGFCVAVKEVGLREAAGRPEQVLLQ